MNNKLLNWNLIMNSLSFYKGQLIHTFYYKTHRIQFNQSMNWLITSILDLFALALQESCASSGFKLVSLYFSECIINSLMQMESLQFFWSSGWVISSNWGVNVYCPCLGLNPDLEFATTTPSELSNKILKTVPYFPIWGSCWPIETSIFMNW